MILTEEHSVKKNRHNADLYRRIDAFCYSSKNLYNSVNYSIVQCSRISRKLAEGKPLEDWERDLLFQINTAICQYNEKREGKKQLKPVSGSNGFLADAYFLKKVPEKQ